MEPTASATTRTVPPAQWGKDHWSTFGYIETRCVDHRGVPDLRHMRCDTSRHPGLWGHGGQIEHVTKYPTILADGVLLNDHDDWDCADDLETAGLLEVNGTGINPVFKLTSIGRDIAAKLRAHKANGKNFGEFRWAP